MTDTSTAPVLYIAYDGMLEPLGQSQVLAYLERLAKDRNIHLISFEKPADWSDQQARKVVTERIKAAGIRWHPRRYHKTPTALAPSWDMWMGIVLGLWLIIRYRIRVVHARSYVPAVIALVLKRLTGVKMLFDMRGFWADERVDGGLWPADGRMLKTAKWFERQCLLHADHVVSLTQAAVREMRGFSYLKDQPPPFSVIPTCADLDRFRPRTGINEDFIVGYVGSAGTWYRFDVVVACFAEILRQRPEAQFLILNRAEHDYIRETLNAGEIPPESFEIHSAMHTEVPQLMNRMKLGIFFYKPSFSRLACAPTKLGEFLGCGIPCLSNSGVGDMADILRSDNVGIALDDFSPESLHGGVAAALKLAAEPGVQSRCINSAHRWFSLETGVRSYAAIYESLTEDG